MCRLEESTSAYARMEQELSFRMSSCQAAEGCDESHSCSCNTRLTSRKDLLFAQTPQLPYL